ncbi:3-oxoacyl-[acyl-carrier-protein] synthase III C-terminal domain-containing protein [Peribacillus sp. FSL H8-0477]|uniref:3-oxoacyl-[acyl-carrier-protein] synthase III C-terminal domain-containing protein n=1 Tax=Peribacillus sp. FSL H8-0477 TaxID=2921388 RepID=UPI0030FB598F
MTTGIILKEAAVYHPSKIVNNDYYLKHFQEQGKNIEGLLEALGRENRYIADYEKENTLTMAIEASKKVLKKANLTGSDIDSIIFVSSTPEFFAPPSAIAIHHAIEGKPDAVVSDMNAACVGMIIAVEQASRTMIGNPNLQRTLVVASEQLHRYASKEEAVTFASFGDGACAVILEKEENKSRGFIDSAYKIDTDSIDKIVLPACGVSNLSDVTIDAYDKRVKWENVNNDKAFLSTVELIEKLLIRHDLTTADIQAFCFSQLSRKNIYKIQEAFNEDITKFPIVGTEYGYTGSASPFMAFERAVSTGQLKQGDYVIFWSVGAGSAASAMLFRY